MTSRRQIMQCGRGCVKVAATPMTAQAISLDDFWVCQLALLSHGFMRLAFWVRTEMTQAGNGREDTIAGRSNPHNRRRVVAPVGDKGHLYPTRRIMTQRSEQLPARQSYLHRPSRNCCVKQALSNSDRTCLLSAKPTPQLGHSNNEWNYIIIKVSNSHSRCNKYFGSFHLISQIQRSQSMFRTIA